LDDLAFHTTLRLARWLLVKGSNHQKDVFMFARLPTCIFLITVSASSIVACKEEAAPGARKIVPFSGKLTEEVLSKANRAISVYTPAGEPTEYAPTLAAAKIALGEPTRINGTASVWGFASGDKCTTYVLIDDGGKAKSSGVQSIYKAASKEYAECLTAIGAPAPAK
jgi:hypothetical protein